MKRELTIAAVVLVPFAGLVVFGFSLLGDPPRIVIPIEEPLPPLPPPPPPTPTPAPVRAAPRPPGPPPLPIDVTVVAPPQVPPGPADPPKDPSDEARRIPMLAAVEPLVQQCFRDASDRLREPMRVTVSFNTTPEGRFAEVVIRRATWQEPQLSACVIDAFEDARFEPSGLVLRRRTHTFGFAGPDGGR